MEREILRVCEIEDGQYQVSADNGTNVAEIMFGMAVTIKLLVRDGLVTSPIAAEALLHKYLTDPQYDEVGQEQVEELEILDETSETEPEQTEE